MKESHNLLLELDKLKSIYRKSYVTGGSRNENSAEHSWHLAVAILSFQKVFPSELNVDHAIRMALVHDICEIGAGDVCTYHSNDMQSLNERRYLTSFAQRYPFFGKEVLNLWEEYEEQATLESRWVRLIDKLLPFLLNITTEGKTWREQSITKEMVVSHHGFIEGVSPEIYNWMQAELNHAVNSGWLLDA